MEINQGILQSLHVGFSTIFNNSLSAAQSDWSEIAQKVMSTTKRNEFAWMRNIPQLKRDLGPTNFENLIRQGYTIENHRYKTGVEVDVDDLEDDNLGSYQMVFSTHAREAADWLGHAVYSLLPMGLTSSGKAFDGVNFFSASHTKIDGTTYSNYDSGSAAPWYLLDTTKAVKPLIIQERKGLALTLKSKVEDDNVFHDDKVQWSIKGRYGFGYAYPQLAYCSKETLNATNLEAAITAMLAHVRDDGTKLNIKPNVLVVGPTHYMAARKLLENENDSNGATNIHKGSLKLAYSQYCEAVSLDIAAAG